MSDGFIEKWFPALISAMVLSVFAVIGTTLVGLAWPGLAERIEQNKRDALLRCCAVALLRCCASLPQEHYDNQLLDDTVEVLAPDLGEVPTRIFRARKDGKDVAAVSRTLLYFRHHRAEVFARPEPAPSVRLRTDEHG